MLVMGNLPKPSLKYFLSLQNLHVARKILTTVSVLGCFEIELLKPMATAIPQVYKASLHFLVTPFGLPQNELLQSAVQIVHRADGAPRYGAISGQMTPLWFAQRLVI